MFYSILETVYIENQTKGLCKFVVFTISLFSLYTNYCSLCTL